MNKLLIYVEISQPFCANTYGVAPCTAAISDDNPSKCYNSRLTCQDRANFSNEPVTLRFAKPCDYLPIEIEAIASIDNVSVSPSVISLGEDLGLRAEMRVTLKDHPWSDTGPGGDPYRAERILDSLASSDAPSIGSRAIATSAIAGPENLTAAYNPFTSGTFWGKWRARVRYLRGQPIRLIIGELGQSIAEMETRHFIVESVDGPNADGSVTIIAKDPLKLADGDRAQAPTLSQGYLQADLTNVATTFDVAPTGIGAEYPASGYIAIGGAEICPYTRTGDTFTITRGALGTEAQEHDAEDRVQVVLQYVGQDPADIIYDLFVNYANIDPDYIDLEDWQAETDAYLGRVFSATIGEPTDVSKLVSELIQQAALSIWWDDIERKIKLRVLRQISTDAATFSPDNIREGTYSSREQPDKRVSQVWVFYGQRNPLKKLDEEENYRSAALVADADAEVDYNASAIKKIYSRWIAPFGRSSAERTATILLGRYRDPPRRFTWSLFRDQAEEVFAGSGYQIQWWNLQDETGAVSPVPIQITREAPTDDGATVGYEAEEANFTRLDPVDLDNRAITIDTNTTNFNLRTAHDLLYPAPEVSDTFTLTCIINTGAIVGGSVLGSPAFDVGDWTGITGVTLNVIVNGRIQGRGGKGGNGHSVEQNSDGGFDGLAGEAGSTALYTRRAINLTNNGEIWGGGGGGGAGGASTSGANRASGAGGGGQGFRPGDGGAAYGDANLLTQATAGTTNAPGQGGNGRDGARNSGGDGGGPGQAGFSGRSASSDPGKAGGAAGSAIDGDSYITFAATGDIRGTRIN